MPTVNSMAMKRETLNLRIRPAERELIDRAAKARGKNRTDFVLEAARGSADRATYHHGRSAGLSGISCPFGSGSCAQCRAA